eukprot:6174879-Pleurochrysis_carterae.AAC.2
MSVASTNVVKMLSQMQTGRESFGLCSSRNLITKRRHRTAWGMCHMCQIARRRAKCSRSFRAWPRSITHQSTVTEQRLLTQEMDSANEFSGQPAAASASLQASKT